MTCIRSFLRIALLVFLLPLRAFSEPDLRVGVSAPLTGPAAAWGIDVKNVLLFANDKIAGGKYTFLFQDDKCDPKEAVSIAHKFADVDGLKQVFIVAGTVTLAAAPVYGRSNILVMAPIVTPRAISNLGNYIFRTTPGDAKAASALANEISRVHKNVAVLTEQSEYSVGFLEDFKSAAQSKNLSLFNQDYAATETDFKGLLLTLKAKKPDALFVNANTERTFAVILRQAKDLKIQLPVYGAYIPGSAAFLSLAGENAEGIIFPDYPSIEGLLNDEGKELLQEYISKYGTLQSFEYTFPAVYEAFKAFDAAVQSKTSPIDYLHRNSFNGMFGQFSFDEHGDVVGVSPSLKIIHEGKAVLFTKP